MSLFITISFITANGRILSIPPIQKIQILMYHQEQYLSTSAQDFVIICSTFVQPTVTDQQKQASLISLSLSLIYKLQLKTAMPHSKPKSRTVNSKQTPFNINISFNIHPKNVVHHQDNSQVKISQHLYQPNIANTHRNRDEIKRKPKSEGLAAPRSDREGKRSSEESLEIEFLSKKRLDKIKKSFLNKINDFDITIPLPSSNNEPLICEKDGNKSSIMSAKIPQYQPQPTHPEIEHTEMNIRSYEGKSKVLRSYDRSKILGVDKKSSSEFKPRIMPSSQSRHEVRLSSHVKGYSTFTDVKSTCRTHKKGRKNSELYQGKRTARPKEESLKQKLEKFKIDMGKLASFYEENEVLKTKLSSEYYQIRSREISKEMVDMNKLNDIEQHQKLQEIKQFQVMKDKVRADPPQQFSNIKEMYQDLRNMYYVEEIDGVEKECTLNIVEYYQKMSEQKAKEKNIHHDIINYDDFSDSQAPSSVGQDDKIIIKEAGSSSMDKLEEFVKFLQSSINKKNAKFDVREIYSQFVQQHQTLVQSSPLLPLSAPTLLPKDKEDEKQQVLYLELDNAINKELESIPNMLDQISEIDRLQEGQMLKLQNWENTYKEELLKMKGKMWRQYINIKNVIQNRIRTGQTGQNIETRKEKKQKKIMKCLSEKLISANKVYFQDRIKPLQIKKVQQRSEKSEEFDQLSPLSPIQQIIYPQLEQFSPIDHQSIIKRTSFDEVISNYKEDNEFIGDKQQAKRQQFNQVLIDDLQREDIFQFIFLDLCIELYQELVQKEQISHLNPQTIKSAQRIVKSIRSYITQTKANKKKQDLKRIGIVTNLTSVKTTLHQLNSYIFSDIITPNNTKTIKERVITKLMNPLGPNQLEILKSLRLSFIENQPAEQNSDDFEEDILLVMQPQLFLYFQNQVIKIHELTFNKYYEAQERQTQRINFLRNCTHIFHKAIYDCLNEHLDYHRIFGIWGKPFSWKRKPSFHHQICEDQLEIIMNFSMSEVLRCTTFSCGLMVDKEDSIIKDISADVHYVRRLQDERIYKLLEDFVCEMEEKWFFHDDEQTEILIEMSHIVWTLLIKQTVRDLSKFIL